MIRTHWMTSSAAAKAYYRQSDYYASTPGEWLGKGAALLGLTGIARPEQFDALADNLDPRTGSSLTTHTREGRRVGLDMTFNSTKSVGLARELAGSLNGGDHRIEAAHREAVAYVVGLVEDDMQARVRSGGRNENRTTANLVAYRVTHRDTRISPEDQRPDPSLHDHVFIFNATYDAVEGKWKAAEMGQIKHDAPYYEAAYHNRLAANLRALGYGVRRKDKAFEIAGISDELVKKFSRRTQYIEGVAAKLGITRPESKSKLGATTRLGKAKELADDLNGYYVSRLTDAEKQQLGDLIGKPSYVCSEEKAARYAIEHLFERKSVVEERKLYEEALRHGIGSVTIEGVKAETLRQGLLLRDREATTKKVLAEEARVIAFAREGAGTCRPIGRVGAGHEKGRPDESKRPLVTVTSTPALESKSDTATLSPEPQAVSPLVLSPEQQALCRHIWDSNDRVIMVEGDAGTGKTQTMQRSIPGINLNGVFLAPSATASRGELREKGFANADTITHFLDNAKFREQARNGFVYIDEAPLAGLSDIDRVIGHCRELNARLILQGDRKQHKSVSRGDLFYILDKYASLPIGRLTENWRQKHAGYKQAVAAIAAGRGIEGFDKLVELDWVKEVGDNAPLVDEYLAALRAGKSVLVVAPTHAEGEKVTDDIRARLKEIGVVKGEEKTLPQLRPLNWTDAEKGDLERYTGTETLVFHRNSGTFKAGQAVRVADWKKGDRWASPSHFSVYSSATLPVAAGDLIRFTANGQTKDKKHRINNGMVYPVKGFDKDGDPVLSNGWTVSAGFGHLAHGYVSTSHASQGKTVDRVLIAMGSDSLGAINAEQFYVSVSRGKERATIFSDLPADQLREAILKKDARKSATDLVGKPRPKPKRRGLLHSIVKRAQERFRRLRETVVGDNREPVKQQEREYGGCHR